MEIAGVLLLAAVFVTGCVVHSLLHRRWRRSGFLSLVLLILLGAAGYIFEPWKRVMI